MAENKIDFKNIDISAENVADVAVIGAGHAGIEAGLASARLGCKTLIFTLNLDWVGNLPCNPSIGGTAKGHLVREIDALGGEMGIAADETTLQSRMLNRGKGPAVHSLRAQIDRRRYSDRMKWCLEGQENLFLKQGEVTAFERIEITGEILAESKNAAIDDGEYWILRTKMNEYFMAKSLIIATGTFLKAKIFVGDVNFDGGPDGMFPANEMLDSLLKLGISMRRFKTGTPARVKKASIDFSKMDAQPGEEPITPFSFETKIELKNYLDCHITWTNDDTKRVIMENLDKSAMYGGDITGIGARYCPSIEDKIVRFADKERHQVFVEPCGLHTQEMYLQGISTSMPISVQKKILSTISGLENIEIMRPAYAIEYDCCDPLQLDSTLEFLEIPNLYSAGQFNGSSGYEEAAAQGIVAGINAALKLKGREPMRLDRASSYIGTLVDDLVTKGCADPYRMMTSRSEYRLILRQDNADARLTPIGREVGLVGDERWGNYLLRKELKEKELKRLENIVLPPSDKLNEILVSRETTPVKTGIRMSELLKRPQISYEALASVDEGRPSADEFEKVGVSASLIFEQVEIELKYEGYIKRQLSMVEEMRRLEKRLLPEDINYKDIKGLRNEAVEKLSKVRPHSLGQASRISGVSPADISVLIIYLTQIAK